MPLQPLAKPQPDLIRNAPAKPPRGEKRREHRAKSKATAQGEKAAKRESKQRDSYRCRWPHCGCRATQEPLESCHLVHKGIGGDPKLIRTTVDGLITLCQDKHRGPRSLDSGDLTIVPFTRYGASGPCKFYERDKNDKFQCAGRESAVHVLEPLK